MRSAPAAERGFSPLDEELALLPGPYSPYLVESIVRLGVQLPFERVPAEMRHFTTTSVSVETARRWTERAGAAQVALELAAVERLERETPDPPQGPAVQQLSVDGAMVPLVHGEWAEVKTMAIGTVEQRLTTAGEREAHTTDLSYFSRLTDAETFGRLTLVETYRRGTETAGRVCAVLDGAVWQQGVIDLHRPDAVRILDFPHAGEHLSTAAHALLGSGPEAKGWITTQLHNLKHEDPDAVLAALRTREPSAAVIDLSAARAVRDGAVRYLEERREQIAYAAFRAQGYPIGSGSVESANKLVVEARLKGAGMRWAREHVNPMVAVRALLCSDRWDAAWPGIWQQLRQEVATRRCQTRAARAARRAVVPAALPPPVEEVPAAAPILPDTPPRGAREKLIVDGKPTRNHPWKRSFLTQRAS